MNAEEILQRIIEEANERLVEDTAPRDLRWAVACYSAERMLSLTREGAFAPVDVAEHYLKGLLRDFPGGEDTARGCAMNSIASCLLGMLELIAARG